MKSFDRMCRTQDCPNLSTRLDVCDDCARREPCTHRRCGKPEVRSGFCAKHLPYSDAVKLKGRWRTVEEVIEYFQTRSEMRGVTWAMETVTRSVHEIGIDEKGHKVSVGRCLQERVVWVGTKGTFRCQLWAELDWRTVPSASEKVPSTQALEAA